MYDISKELDFPFMAGSSIPVMYREPEVEVPLGAPVRHGVALGWGNRDSYGFHLLETIQCLIDRRKGGETGVKAVQAFDGDDVWKFLDENGWARHLFEAALAASKTRIPGRVRDLVKDPGVFVVEHRDGVKTATFVIPGAFRDFNFAVDVEGQSKPLATMIWSSDKKRPHFTCMLKASKRCSTLTAPLTPSSGHCSSVVSSTSPWNRASRSTRGSRLRNSMCSTGSRATPSIAAHR